MLMVGVSEAITDYATNEKITVKFDSMVFYEYSLLWCLIFI